MTKYAVLDLDGVVYDFVDSVARYAAETHNIPRETMPPAEIWDFFSHQWGWSLDQFLTTFSEGVLAGEIFAKGAPLPGAVEGWAAVRDAADFVHVVTDRSPKGAAPAAAKATVAWLQTNGLTYDLITITADKVDAIRANAPEGAEISCIDDRDKNFYAYEEAGFNSVIFDQPWNAHVDTSSRAKSLVEFATLL